MNHATRTKFGNGLAEILLGAAKALGATGTLREPDERLGPALALRGFARLLSAEADRLELASGPDDDRRGVAIRAELCSLGQKRVMQ